MKSKFIQFSCREGNRPDYRQARAVLQHKPDIIIFECPEKNGESSSSFNAFDVAHKPFKEVEQIQADLRKTAKQFKYALSDERTWGNIAKLWKGGHDVLLYNVDAPRELRSEFFEVWQHMYPCALKNWLWWVQIYLRERIMANHIRAILANYTTKPDPTVLVFLQSFHWRHVQFLLKNPSKKEIWQYYFGKFKEVTTTSISEKIQRNNRVFYKYWRKYSDF